MGDCSAAASTDERAEDDRVAEALDDPEFIYDLRKLNGNPGSTDFDILWEELRLYIEELTPAMDDRQHSDVPHMPVAISLHHLLNIVKIRIEQKYPDDKSKLQLPSLKWLHLQFWSHNPYSSSTLDKLAELT